MVTIIIPKGSSFDDTTQEFVPFRDIVLQLEHSLVSISKWESKWHKPFLSKTPKTTEESIDYIRCMTTTSNVDPIVYDYITNDNIIAVSEYVDNPMTATIFGKEHKHEINRDIITSEIIYYWMVALQIPFQCEKWHLNRLLTLINVCNIKNQPAKKSSTKDIMSRNAMLNEQRRKELNTKG